MRPEQPQQFSYPYPPQPISTPLYPVQNSNSFSGAVHHGIQCGTSRPQGVNNVAPGQSVVNPNSQVGTAPSWLYAITAAAGELAKGALRAIGRHLTDDLMDGGSVDEGRYPAGDPAGNPVGDATGYPAGAIAGYPAGDAPGYPAAAIAGYPPGDAAGYPAAAIAGYPAAAIAGYPSGDAADYAGCAVGDAADDAGYVPGFLDDY